jgi:hypothetical protein
MFLFGKPNVAKLKAKGDCAGLLKELSNPDPAIKREAAEALSILGWNPATDEQRLEFLIASGSWGEVSELGRTKPQLLVERFLSEAQRHPGEKVGVPGISLSGDQVGELLTPPGKDIRYSLVSALRDVGDPAVTHLIVALEGKESDRSSHASWALVEIGEATLEPLITRNLPEWSGGKFNSKNMATIALAAKRSTERGGKGFVSHLHFAGSGSFNKFIALAGLEAGLAGENDKFASWQDKTIDDSLAAEPDTLAGINCTLTLPDEATAQKIASNQDVLRSVLGQLKEINAEILLRALLRGRVISREVFKDPAKSDFSVKLTLEKSAQAQPLGMYHCSKCGKVLDEIGIQPDIQAVQEAMRRYASVSIIKDPSAPDEVRDDPFLFRGFVCPNCLKAFCPGCSNMQGEVCPSCGQKTLMPAYRPLLAKYANR